MKFGTRLIVALLALLMLGGGAVGIAAKKKGKKDPTDKTPNIRAQLKSGKVRNVILFIGDGMDENAVTAGRNYQYGAAGKLMMDRLKFAGSVTTYALDELADRDEKNPKPFYVTDSAASGTAWATGQKTGLLRISTEAFTNKALPTIAELAQRKGFRTGNVTTDSVTGATPAVQMSHVRLRNCQAPTDCTSMEGKAIGRLGSISEQAADSKMDVILGGGRSDFEKTIPYGPDQGKTVIQSAERQGFKLLTDRDQLNSFNGGKRVLGLFANGTISPEWRGPEAARNWPISQHVRCETGNRPAEQPPLVNMTKRAIQILNKRSRGKKNGFFLQVEGAGIDKGAHAANPCRQIGELISFDEAIKAGIKFAKKSPRTLVIVTADHGQAGQILPGPGADRSAILITNEGSLMTMGYGTKAGDNSQEHSGITVPVRSFGPRAANLMGLKNQTDIFDVVVDALKIRPGKK